MAAGGVTAGAWRRLAALALAALVLVPAAGGRGLAAAPGGGTGAGAQDRAGQKDPDGDEETPGGGKDERVVVRTREHEFEAFRLPPNYRNADGSFNQQALVEQQKKRLDTINQRLVAQFRLVETKHYLLFSDADAEMTGLFAKCAEALYANLGRQFSIGPEEKVWDGKCVLMLFATRSAFLRYAQVFDGHGAARAAAYFATEANESAGPQLVHICIPLDTRDRRRLLELFAHEGTHAFFQLYKKPVDLPLWLHEGLAEFMTVVNDATLRPKKQHYAKQLARQATPLAGLLNRPLYAGLSYPEYNVSYTLVDLLVRAGSPKFKAFVDGLKEGKDQETALQEAYGWTLVELERRWRVYVNEYLMKGR